MFSENHPSEDRQTATLHKKRIAKEIRLRGMGVGLAILASFILSKLLVLLISEFFVFSGYMSQNFPKEYSYMDSTLYYIFNGFVYLLVLLVPFILLAFCFRMHLHDIFYFEGQKGALLPWTVLTGFGLALSVNILVNIFLSVFGLIGIKDNASAMVVSEKPIDMLLYILITAFLPAFVEEFCYRGVVMGLLRPFGKGFAIIASAIAFGLMHGNLTQIPFAICGGLIFGYAVEKTHSLWAGVMIHFTNNFVAVLESITKEFAGDVSLSILSFALFFASVFFVLFGIFKLSEKDPAYFQLEQQGSVLSEKKKTMWFFVNAGMISALVFIAKDIISQLTWA